MGLFPSQFSPRLTELLLRLAVDAAASFDRAAENASRFFGVSVSAPTLASLVKDVGSEMLEASDRRTEDFEAFAAGGPPPEASDSRKSAHTPHESYSFSENP